MYRSHAIPSQPRPIQSWVCTEVIEYPGGRIEPGEVLSYDGRHLTRSRVSTDVLPIHLVRLILQHAEASLAELPHVDAPPPPAQPARPQIVR